MRTKLLDKVCTPYTPQTLFYAATFLGLIPEEILPLGQFVALRLSTLYWFQRIGIIASIPCLRRYRHRSGGEVLYLFQLEIELFGLDGQLSHIGLRTSRMTRYEVGNDLLVEMLLTINAVKDALEIIEL